MNGRCENHHLERAIDVCDKCYGEFCGDCLQHPKSRRLPWCTDCALIASGVRPRGQLQLRGARGTAKKRRRALREQDTSSPTGFNYFDIVSRDRKGEPIDDKPEAEPVAAAADEPDEEREHEGLADGLLRAIQPAANALLHRGSDDDDEPENEATTADAATDASLPPELNPHVEMDGPFDRVPMTPAVARLQELKRQATEKDADERDPQPTNNLVRRQTGTRTTGNFSLDRRADEPLTPTANVANLRPTTEPAAEPSAAPAAAAESGTPAPDATTATDPARTEPAAPTPGATPPMPGPAIDEPTPVATGTATPVGESPAPPPPGSTHDTPTPDSTASDTPIPDSTAPGAPAAPMSAPAEQPAVAASAGASLAPVAPAAPSDTTVDKVPAALRDPTSEFPAPVLDPATAYGAPTGPPVAATTAPETAEDDGTAPDVPDVTATGGDRSDDAGADQQNHRRRKTDGAEPTTPLTAPLIGEIRTIGGRRLGDDGGTTAVETRPAAPATEVDPDSLNGVGQFDAGLMPARRSSDDEATADHGTGGDPDAFGAGAGGPANRPGPGGRPGPGAH